jgi:hypothetical protein
VKLAKSKGTNFVLLKQTSRYSPLTRNKPLCIHSRSQMYFLLHVLCSRMYEKKQHSNTDRKKKQTQEIDLFTCLHSFLFSTALSCLCPAGGEYSVVQWGLCVDCRVPGCHEGHRATAADWRPFTHWHWGHHQTQHGQVGCSFLLCFFFLVNFI